MFRNDYYRRHRSQWRPVLLLKVNETHFQACVGGLSNPAHGLPSFRDNARTIRMLIYNHFAQQVLTLSKFREGQTIHNATNPLKLHDDDAAAMSNMAYILRHNDDDVVCQPDEIGCTE